MEALSEPLTPVLSHPSSSTRNEGRDNVGLGHYWLPSAQLTLAGTGWTQECPVAIDDQVPCLVLLQSGKLLQFIWLHIIP